jgi:peptidyl-prolyl cis-trans isomerase B (cyclophilin B)
MRDSGVSVPYTRGGGRRLPRVDGSGVASSNKRERELARQKFERQQQRRLEAEAARKKRRRTIAILSGLGIALAAVAVFLLTTKNTSPTTPTASGSPSASPSATAWNGTPVVKGCSQAPEPTVKTATWKAPEPTPPAAKITLATNCGDIVIATDAAKAPKTVEAMSFLVSQGFYTDSDCFRLTTSGIFVFQCGSANNKGSGSPGFKLPDENLPTSSGQKGYPAGTVAMANAGPGTSDSQFFLVYKDGSTLGPNYTIWGRVVSGLDVLTNVASAGVKGGAQDGRPVQPLVITKATTG